jgi:hypothetical protein
MPVVAIMDDTQILDQRKEPVIPRSFEMLKRPDVTITDFSCSVDSDGI